MSYLQLYEPELCSNPPSQECCTLEQLCALGQRMAGSKLAEVVTGMSEIA